MIHWLWLALLVPILVHLVHRRKARPLPFSTLYFLRMIDQRVARRQRLRELLLLALRLLVLAALIGAIERPMLRTANFRGAHVPTTAVLVLDNSGSMQAVSQGASAFARAQGIAAQALDGLRAEDSAALELVIPADDKAAPTTGIGELKTRLARMTCGHGGGDLAAPLRRAAARLTQDAHPAGEIYAITDMQRQAWGPAVAESVAALPARVPVYLIDAGAEMTQNLAVTEVDTGLRAIVAGVPARIECRIENTAARAATGRISLFIEGEKVAEQEAGASAGGAQSVVFHHAFPKPGAFSGIVELTPDDLALDNRRHFTVTVLERLPVLIVNGAPNERVPHRDAAFFPRLALECGAADLSPVRVDVIEPRDFAATVIDAYACILFAAVPRIEEGWGQRLAAYVRRGGGLILFSAEPGGASERFDAASYNLHLGAGGAALLPAQFDAYAIAPAREPWRIRRHDASHPVFRDITHALDLGEAQVRGAFRLRRAPDESGVGAIMELDDGPLFIERKFGAGSVVLCAAPCTPPLNTLPLRASFLPVMHQLVYYLSRAGGGEGSLDIGAPWTVPVAGTEQSVEVTIRPPEIGENGEPRAFTVRSALAQGRNRARFASTEKPGIYIAEYAAGEMRRRIAMAVNVPAKEGSAERIALSEAVSMLGIKNVIPVRQPEKLAEVVRIERQGLPLWDYLLLAALAFAVCEVFVANVVVKH